MLEWFGIAKNLSLSPANSPSHDSGYGTGTTKDNQKRISCNLRMRRCAQLEQLILVLHVHQIPDLDHRAAIAAVLIGLQPLDGSLERVWRGERGSVASEMGAKYRGASGDLERRNFPRARLVLPRVELRHPCVVGLLGGEG